jgi:hypothetical protein
MLEHAAFTLVTSASHRSTAFAKATTDKVKKNPNAFARKGARGANTWLESSTSEKTRSCINGLYKACRFIQLNTSKKILQVGVCRRANFGVGFSWKFLFFGVVMKQRKQPERPFEHPTSHCEPFTGGFAAPTHIHGGQKYVQM